MGQAVAFCEDPCAADTVNPWGDVYKVSTFGKVDLPGLTEDREEMPDGSRYEGQFLGTDRHGWGKITWADGAVYDGQFNKNDMNGDGTLKWSTGVAYTGQWRQNDLGPRGNMTWPDGRRYCGEFHQGEKHGEGRLSWPNGQAYGGQWVAGKQHGYGFIVGKGPAHLSQWNHGQLLRWLDDKELSRLSSQERACAVVSSGAVRLLSAAWLLAQPQDVAIQRCQELPQEAFLTAEVAVGLLQRRYNIVVMSYAWLTAQHPDPDCFHLRTLRLYLRKHMDYFVNFQDVGVFWDFASLRLKPGNGRRSQEEQGMLTAGRASLGALYGGKRTVVVKLTTVPKATLSRGYRLTAYDTRGWCFCEAAIAAISKPADQLLDLGAAAEVLADESTTWEALRDCALGMGQPPLLPEDMKSALERRSFADASDRPLVSEQYASFFSEAAANSVCLGLANQSAKGSGWSDLEVTQLCRALPAFKACKAVSLANHLALGGAALVSLRGKLPEVPALQRLVLPQHLQLTSEGQALIAAWSHAGKKPDNLVWRSASNSEEQPTSLMWRTVSKSEDQSTI